LYQLCVESFPKPCGQGSQRDLLPGHTFNLKCQLEGNRFDNASVDQNPKIFRFALDRRSFGGFDHVGWANLR
jgi:hypothetical protein